MLSAKLYAFAEWLFRGGGGSKLYVCRTDIFGYYCKLTERLERDVCILNLYTEHRVHPTSAYSKRVYQRRCTKNIVVRYVFFIPPLIELFERINSFASFK